MSIRHLRLAGLGLAGALAVVPVTSTSALAGTHGHPHAHAAHHANKGKRPSKFTATGTITAVTDSTVILADKGGSRDLHGTSVTVTVGTTTKVTRNDAVASLADLQPGDHVAVNGTRLLSGTYVARHVNAEAPQSGTTG